MLHLDTSNNGPEIKSSATERVRKVEKKSSQKEKKEKKEKKSSSCLIIRLQLNSVINIGVWPFGGVGNWPPVRAHSLVHCFGLLLVDYWSPFDDEMPRCQIFSQWPLICQSQPLWQTDLLTDWPLTPNLSTCNQIFSTLGPAQLRTSTKFRKQLPRNHFHHHSSTSAAATPFLLLFLQDTSQKKHFITF